MRTRRAIRFKGRDSRLVMLMMARSRRELPIIQFAAQDLFGDRQAIFVEHPLRQIDKPPAHDFMIRWGRTGLDHGDERLPWLVVEQAGASSRLAVDEAVRPVGVEPKRPIADDLKPHAPNRAA